MPSLKDLSFELVCRVVESLCLHCSCPPQICQCNRGCLAIDPTCDPNSKCLPECPPSEVKARIRALGSLCLTSRLLNIAATQHLFHRPDTDKWWLLVRTLLRRPHLAAHVKRLSFPELYLDKYPNSADVASDVWSYYSARLGEARDAAALRGDPDRYGEYTDVRNPDDNDYCPPTFEDTTNERAALLATLCPAAETLEAVVGWPSICYLSPAGSLPQLRSVELAWPVSGRDNGEGLPLDQLAALFRAAPRLSVVRCRNVWDEGADDGDVDLEPGSGGAVTRLELSCATLTADALQTLLRACPRLETFKYRAMGGEWATVNVEQFHPLQGRDLLFELEKKLQKVVLDFSSCSNWFDTNDNGEWSEWSATERKDMALVQSFREKGIESEIKI